jgi:hypothetical protein
VRRGAATGAISSAGTALPEPKYISSGVWPRNAECGSTWLCSWTQIVRGDSSVQRRARANQRTERQDDGYDEGIADGRLFDGAGNLNESAGAGFLVGAGRGVRT